MSGIVEQHSLANRLASTECDQTNRPAIDVFLDCDGAGRENGHEPARRALCKEDRVSLKRLGLHQLCELVQQCFRHCLEEMRLAQLVAYRGRHAPQGIRRWQSEGGRDGGSPLILAGRGEPTYLPLRPTHWSARVPDPS